MWLDKYIHYSSSHQFKNIPWYKNWTTLAQLQSNRMFFWWELCKLPLEHWYFGWQFESSKLQPAWASCSVHLVPHGKNSLKFSKMFQVLLQYFEDGYVSFCVDEPLNNYQDLLDRVKKAEQFFSRHLRPANRNIIQRSFFASIYWCRCWQELQFTCLWSFQKRFAVWIRHLPTSLFEGKREWPSVFELFFCKKIPLRPRANVESNSNIIHRTYLFWNRRMNDAKFAAIKFDSN